jgi:predicted secreted protein
MMTNKQGVYMGRGLQPTSPANQNLKNAYILDTVTSNVVHDILNFNQQMHTNFYVIHSIVGP